MKIKAMNIASLFFVFSLLFTIEPVFAAADSTAHDQPQQQAVAAGSNTLSVDNLDQLISTLETEQERQRFIDNLKTLQAARQRDESADSFPLLDALDLERRSGSVLDSIMVALEDYGLSDSTAGGIIRLALVAIGLVVLVLLNGWLSRKFDRSFDPMRKKLHLSPTRFDLYFLTQRWFVYFLALVTFFIALDQTFNLSVQHVFPGFKFMEISAQLVQLLFVVLLFITVWEGVNAVTEYLSYTKRVGGNARMKTLIPVVRNICLAVLSVLGVLVILAELGINVMPLLAGAGVLGIAIGFGAQTLFKDFITGMTIIFEDLVQIGDVVRVGDRSGLVEKITIRKIQLRALDGTVHTVPFGEIAVVDNLTKEFSYYLMDIGVAYRENIDEVMQCLQDIDKELRQDEKFKQKILEPLEIFGLDNFADSAVVIKARIKTRPIEQWSVGREFNRRMKMAFDERGIEIPFPHQTLYFGEDKSGQAPSAKLSLTATESQV